MLLPRDRLPGVSCRCPSAPKHNAHSPKTVRIQYRWHPLFGQDLKLHRTARFPRGEYVFCELPNGTIAGLPAWMTDPGTCASIEVGQVIASAEALIELRSLMDRVMSSAGALVPTPSGRRRPAPGWSRGVRERPSAMRS